MARLDGKVALVSGGIGAATVRTLFLASDDSSFSTGAKFVADGGETAGNAAFVAG